MPEDEQRQRMETMSAAVEAYTVQDWAEEQLASFPEVATIG
jgi:trehalose-6-phosphate synthase